MTLFRSAQTDPLPMTRRDASTRLVHSFNAIVALLLKGKKCLDKRDGPWRSTARRRLRRCLTTTKCSETYQASAEERQRGWFRNGGAVRGDDVGPALCDIGRSSIVS